jgi:hypothetical protein
MGSDDPTIGLISQKRTSGTGSGIHSDTQRDLKNAPFVLDTHDPLVSFGVSLLRVSLSIVAMLFPPCDQPERIRYMLCAKSDLLVDGNGEGFV